jgi:hypothetical protein
MLSILSTILGSGDVISKGMDLIDDAFESDEEKRESKTKAKIDLMKAYAPFKVAQRYVALMFMATYIFSFFLVLGMTLVGKAIEVDAIFNVLEQFKVGWIVMTIVMFYFGGGMVESFGNVKKDTKAD